MSFSVLKWKISDKEDRKANAIPVTGVPRLFFRYLHRLYIFLQQTDVAVFVINPVPHLDYHEMGKPESIHRRVDGKAGGDILRRINAMNRFAYSPQESFTND